MSLKVDNKINIAKDFALSLTELEKEFAIAVSDEVAMLGKRTRSGLTVEGGQMVAYSPEYAAFKGGTGRSKRDTKSKKFFNSVSKSTRPDLTLTGDMLKAITYTTKRIGNILRAEVFFSRDDQEEKAQWNNKTRPFFDFSKKQRANILQVVQDFINKL